MAIRFFIFALLGMVLISPVRGFAGVEYSLVLGFTLYFFLTHYCLKKSQGQMAASGVLLSLVCGLWLIQLPLRVVYFSTTLTTLPDAIFHTLGILFGFLRWQLKKPFNLLTTLLGGTLAVLMFFQGYGMWFHKLNFDTFTGRIFAVNLPTPFEAFDERKTLITDYAFRDKITLLDYWFTGCEVCFAKFPHVQEVFDKYKDDSSVAIYAVDKPIEEDRPDQAFEMIKDLGYTFPVLIAKDEDMPEKWRVKVYPTTFVINREGQIVYRGDIEGAIKMVDELRASSP